MKIKSLSILTISSVFSLNILAASVFPTKFELPTQVAESIAKAAIAECKKSNANVSISVVNDQGRLVYFYRGKGSGSNTIQTSYRKAYTSASLKAPTSALSEIVEAKGYSQLGKMEDDILLLTGGLPIFHEGQLVGAIGLSGSPNPKLEEACGIEGLKILTKAS